MNPAIIAWVAQELQRGIPNHTIWESLEKKGFSAGDISAAFVYVQKLKSRHESALPRQTSAAKIPDNIPIPTESGVALSILDHPLLVLPVLSVCALLVIGAGAYYFMENSSPLEGPELKFSTKNVNEQSTLDSDEMDDEKASKEKIPPSPPPPDDDEEEEKEQRQPYCGDNKISLNEACDGYDLNRQNCQSKGFVRGHLACKEDCSDFDTSTCSNELLYRCGNGVKDPEETCDGKDISSQTCQIFGFSSGSLACKSDCSAYDTSKCVSVEGCQNNVKEGTEVCDGTDLAGQSCLSRGFSTGTLACNSDCSDFDTSACRSHVCGNGIVEGTENCDGTDLLSKTCASIGLDAGTIKCKSDCTLDTSLCTKAAKCQNNVKEGNEACDGTDLAGQSCQSKGFDSGTLSCKTDCSALDTSLCTTTQACQNNIKEGTEVCDGDDLASQSCIKLGFDYGVLNCKLDCMSFDTSRCRRNSVCGNNIPEGTEACDGSSLSGQSCANLGFSAGTLKCRSDCAGFDTSSCTSNSCGNNIKESSEACDGTDLAGQSCASQGQISGQLSCKSDCKSFDISKCTKTQSCNNNNIKEGTEACDGSDLFGQTCLTKGFDAGTLSCLSNCSFDTSSCEKYVCGNNLIQGSEVCDGTNVGFKSCLTLGFDGGTLKCKTDCSGYDTSSCSISQNCPNNIKEGTEACDGIDLAGQSCVSKGFTAGSLSCKSDCTGFVTSSCTTCGNNVKEGSEVCDKNDLNQKTCLTQTGYSGTLKCKTDCKSFDTSLCTQQSCGNSIVEGSEVCDSSNLNSQTCQDFGFTGGTLKCQSGCIGYDTTSCTGSTSCGDNQVNNNEYCDGTALNGNTCQSIGYLSGNLKCQSDCKAYDTTSCVLSNSCGNGQIEGQEECDGSNLQGQTCVSINQNAGTNFTGGTLRCYSNCEMDVSGCS